MLPPCWRRCSRPGQWRYRLLPPGRNRPDGRCARHPGGCPPAALAIATPLAPHGPQATSSGLALGIGLAISGVQPRPVLLEGGALVIVGGIRIGKSSPSRPCHRALSSHRAWRSWRRDVSSQRFIEAIQRVAQRPYGWAELPSPMPIYRPLPHQAALLVGQHGAVDGDAMASERTGSNS